MTHHASNTTFELHRREVLRQIGAVAATALPGVNAFAQQQYPTRPVTVIFPGAPGTPSDLVGRKLTAVMGEKAGVPFVADNKPGANGVIGVQAFLKTPADGYNVLFTTTSITATNKAMIKDLPYEPTKDLVPIGFGIRIWLMVAVNAKLPYKNIQEFIAFAKANPDKLNYGFGTPNVQLGGKLFEQLTGVRFTYVPYKSHASMVLALMTGEVDLTVTDYLSLGSFLKAGTIRALAATAPSRIASIPDVPTMAELGLPPVEMMSAHLFMAKSGTPPDVLARLAELMKAAAQSKEFTDWLTTTGFDNYLVTGADAVRESNKEIGRIGAIARNAGLQPS